MAASFSLPTVLANLAAGNQPLSLIDGDLTALRDPLLSLNTFSNYYTDVGAANAYAITVSAPQTVSQAAGLRVQVLIANANTGASTLQINALAAKNILHTDLTALSPRDLPANCIADFIYDGTQYLLTGVSYPISRLTKIIYGLTYANNGTDSIDISAGGATDATSVFFMTGAALTKSITSAWVVGTGQGMLDTGAVGNSDYYIWIIARLDTGVVDYLASLSSTAPTMPANYTMKRLIGWFRRSGGSNVAFHTYELEGGGLQFAWDASRADIDSAALTTSRLLSTLSVPANLSVIVDARWQLNDAGGGNVIFQCPDETDAAPAIPGTPGVDAVVGAGGNLAGRVQVRTSASGQIATRSTAAIDNYRLWTVSFRWARRN